MSKRLQVLFDDAELRQIRRAARHARLTTAEWVRRALREARRTQPASDPDRKLRVVRAAAAHAFPAPDIEQMLAEVERGYRQDAGG
jgi:hypothetical protein